LIIVRELVLVVNVRVVQDQYLEYTIHDRLVCIS